MNSVFLFTITNSNLITSLKVMKALIFISKHQAGTFTIFSFFLLQNIFFNEFEMKIQLSSNKRASNYFKNYEVGCNVKIKRLLILSVN